VYNEVWYRCIAGKVPEKNFEMGNMKKLILASRSPRRKALLEQIGVKFMVIPPDLDESIDGDISPDEYVKVLSLRKASLIAGKLSENGDSHFAVLAADTVVVLDGHILGKPEGEKDAFRMLAMLSGKWHEVVTGIAIVDGDTGNSLSHAERTRVKIRPLTDESVLRYIESGEPFDKAGAYGIQGLGALLVERLEGCYFNSLMLPQMGIETLID